MITYRTPPYDHKPINFPRPMCALDWILLICVLCDLHLLGNKTCGNWKLFRKSYCINNSFVTAACINLLVCANWRMNIQIKYKQRSQQRKILTKGKTMWYFKLQELLFALVGFLVTFPMSMLILDYSQWWYMKSHVGCLPNNRTINVMFLCDSCSRNVLYLFICVFVL